MKTNWLLILLTICHSVYGQTNSISISGTNYDIQEDLYGIHIQKYFTNTYTSTSSTTYVGMDPELAEEGLIGLQPEIVRFPGGGSSRFMHPHPSYGSSYSYGWNLVEICNYYAYVMDDYCSCNCEELAATASVDGTFDDFDELDDFFSEMGSVTDCSDAATDMENNEGGRLREVISNQNDAASPYIDQFITLILNMEDELERDVDVVYCANILTSSATEIVETLNYLITSGVNVVAVELGNETYSNFNAPVFNDDMNYKGFENYWDYINGIGLSASCTKYDELIAKPRNGNTDHDFIDAIRSTYSWGINIKIGVPSIGHDDFTNVFRFSEEEEEEEFTPGTMPMGCPGRHGDWNAGIQSKMSETVEVSGIDYPSFDGVVIHPYYADYDLFDRMEAIVCAAGGIEDDVPDCEDNEIQQLTEEYDFSMVVEELDPAFDGNLLFTTYLFLKRNMELAGVSSNDGYFEQFIKAIQDDYGFFGGEYGKELWTTEWNYANLSDVVPYAGGPKDLFSIYGNTLWQGYVVFEYLIRQIQANLLSITDDDGLGFDADFYTISTIHHFLGESNVHLISNRKDNIGDYNAPVLEDDEYVRRISFLSMAMLAPIFNLDLKYTACSYGGVNKKLYLTTFNKSGEYFVYYVNLNNTDQEVTISGLDSYYTPPPIPMECPTCWRQHYQLNYVGGDECYLDNCYLYNTMGSSYLFDTDFNTFYSDPADIPFTIQPDINKENVILPLPEEEMSEDLSVILPKMSFGYVYIPVHTWGTLRESGYTQKLIAYPNPTSSNVQIELSDSIFGDIEVFDNLGAIVLQYSPNTYETLINLDLSNLANGLYHIKIVFSDMDVEMIPIIKN